MTDDRKLPSTLEQNPAPVNIVGQDAKDKIREQVEFALDRFLKDLPSNYVARITGPLYSLKFQGLLEQLAKIQIQGEETYLDSSYNFVRSEFLWQILGTVVFPDTTDGIIEFDTDIEYRDFLQRMVDLLLEGSKRDPIEEGLNLLTDAEVTVLQVSDHLRSPGTGYTLKDQAKLEVDVKGRGRWTTRDIHGNIIIIEGDLGTGFTEDPFRFERNARRVLKALRPAHTLYEIRNLFLDAFEGLEDEVSYDISNYYYEDLRKFTTGAKAITGTEGETLTDKTLFTDVTRSFASIAPGQILTIESGDNQGSYRVVDILYFPVGADPTPRAYTTSPTGLSGELIVKDRGEVEDVLQDWSDAEEGEVLIIADGPNAGRYRLDVLLGSNGGPIFQVASGSGVTRVRVAPSMLRINTRMPQPQDSQTYNVTVDRLGIRVPHPVTGEDVSLQFIL